MRSYWPAIVVSVVGHCLLIGFVIWGWSATEVKAEAKKPNYIKATLIQLEEKATPKKVKKQPKPPEKNNTKQKELEKKQQEKKLKAKKLAEKKRLKKKQDEVKRKNQIAKKKAEEKAAADKLQKEQKNKLLKELELERQQELERTIAAEKAKLAADKQAADDGIVAQSYNHIIDEKVSENWSRPPSARNDMVVLLRIQLVPTGQVVGVDVTKTSGNKAFDRSAIRAVKKAERFPELQKLPSRIFEKNFRVFNLLFEPKDLRQ